MKLQLGVGMHATGAGIVRTGGQSEILNCQAVAARPLPWGWGTGAQSEESTQREGDGEESVVASAICFASPSSPLSSLLRSIRLLELPASEHEIIWAGSPPFMCFGKSNGSICDRFFYQESSIFGRYVSGKGVRI